MGMLTGMAEAVLLFLPFGFCPVHVPSLSASIA